MRVDVWGSGYENKGLDMKTICQNNTSVEGYSAPECRIFSVCVENCIAQSPGRAGEDEDYEDLEDY